MGNIKKHLEKEVWRAAQLLLRDVVEKKLLDKGIKNDMLLDDLVDHILSNGDEMFHWNDGDDGINKSLTLEFPEEEVEDLSDSINNFLKVDLPKIIHKVVKGGAKSLVKKLENQWPEVKVYERNEMRYFRDRIDLRWAAGLDPLRMMLIASREIGQDFANKLARSKAKTGISKRNAIAILHMRACQTTMEIITLLENGLPDGGYARWRTLYEISVVGFVIDRFGDEIAERYLAHDVVSMRESIINEFRYDAQKYDAEKLEDREREIEDGFQAAVAEFGSSFATPYGWAAHSLGLKRPRFQDLESAVDWDSLPPDYKWSSYKVHAGVAGTIRTLGALSDQHFIHAGATNAGIETPAINTAYSLVHTTSLVFGKLNVFENLIQMQGMILLREKVKKECLRAARKLKQDELELHSGYEG